MLIFASFSFDSCLHTVEQAFRSVRASCNPLKWSWREQEHLTRQQRDHTLLRNKSKLGPSHGVTWALQTWSGIAVTVTSLSTQAGTGREGQEEGWWEIWRAGDAEKILVCSHLKRERPNQKHFLCLEVLLGRSKGPHSGAFWPVTQSSFYHLPLPLFYLSLS